MHREVSPSRCRHPVSLLALGIVAACGSQEEPPDESLAAIHPPEIARIVPADEAIDGSNVPELDPATMNDAEIERAVGAGPRCEFRYTSTGKPVLAVSSTAPKPLRAVLKLNGHLVVLRRDSAHAVADSVKEVSLVAPPIRITIEPDVPEPADSVDSTRQEEATLMFEVGRQLRVGYRGYYGCAPRPRP